MLGVLRKDIYVMWKFSAVTIAFCAAVPLLAGGAVARHTGTWLLSYFPLIFIVNAIVMDEQRWDRYAAITPLRPWEIVLGKYALAWGNLGGTIGASALAYWVGGRGVLAGSSRETLWMAGCVVPLFLAVILPAAYRFGSQMGAALTMYPLVALLGGALFWGQGRLPAAFAALLQPTVPRFLAVVGLHMASIPLSVYFYARRQRGRYD